MQTHKQNTTTTDEIISSFMGSPWDYTVDASLLLEEPDWLQRQPHTGV